MKLSISLATADVEFVDEYARAHDRSRSAAIRDAIEALRRGSLADAYAQAFEEWGAAGEGEAWEQAIGDGI